MYEDSFKKFDAIHDEYNKEMGIPPHVFTLPLHNL